MKTKISNLLIIFLLVTIVIMFLSFPSDIISSVSFAISIWKDNLLPTLFPFFMISNILINYGFIELMEEALKGFMEKAFHLPGSASFVLIGSLISGFPSSSNYINDLLINHKINEDEANYLLKFNHFSNPLFVIGTVGTLLLNNKKIGILILLVHIFSNFIIAFLFRPKKKDNYHSKSSLKQGINNMHKKRLSSSPFTEVLSTSIFKTFKTLLLLLGIITTFLIISTLINKILQLDSITYSILSGFIEMTQGIKLLSGLNIGINYKACLIVFFLSFGGFSIHMQVMSILSSTQIKYFPYLLSRLLHGLIASGLLCLIWNFIN